MWGRWSRDGCGGDGVGVEVGRIRRIVRGCNWEAGREVGWAGIDGGGRNGKHSDAGETGSGSTLVAAQW